MGITITSITPKQLSILKLLSTFRFLNRHHIQTLLQHKDYRLINAWLNNLYNNHLVGRIYSNIFGENTKPAIYYLTVKSRPYLEKEEGFSSEAFKKVYREHKRSPKFITHCQTIADIYLQFRNQTKDKATLHFYTKTDLAGINYLLKPLPDAYIAIEEKHLTKRYFLEVIDEGTPRFAIRKRIQQYFEYAENKDWETSTKHPFPFVLIRCPNIQIKTFIEKHIHKVMEENLVDISFTLV